MLRTSVFITVTASFILLTGCANREGVAPSQNTSLHSVSPSPTAISGGGAMQRSLDAWLKEEWAPLTNNTPRVTTETKPDGTIVTTKIEAATVTTTTKKPDGTVTTTTATTAPEPEDNTPFTLQKYADKWKVYQENKAKMNGGKPKEPSHIEMMQSLPVVGK